MACLRLAACTTTIPRARPATSGDLQTQIAKDAATGDERRPGSEPVRLLYQRGAAQMPEVSRPAAAGSNGDSAQAGSLVDPLQLRGYEVKRRWPGAMEGLLTGLLAGAVGGAAVGYAQGDDADTFIQFTAGEKAVAFGVLGTVAGGALGLAIGALVGHTDRYEF